MSKALTLDEMASMDKQAHALRMASWSVRQGHQRLERDHPNHPAIRLMKEMEADLDRDAKYLINQIEVEFARGETPPANKE